MLERWRRQAGHLRRMVPALVTGILSLGLWEAGVVYFEVPEYFIPRPSAVLVYTFTTPDLWLRHTTVTLLEMLYGFVIAALLGVAIAVVFAVWPGVQRALYPLVISFQNVPKVAIAPIFVLWFGYGLAPKVAVVTVLCFFPVLVNTLFGLQHVDPNLLDLFRTVSASRLATLWKLQLPHSLPFMFGGLRIGITLSVIGAIVGEFVGSNAGLGYVMTFATGMMDTVRLFASILAASVVGMAAFYLIAWLERALVPWHQPTTQEPTP